MNAYERIEGSEKLTRIFGYWPRFHDASVVRFSIDWRRTIDRENDGPMIETLIHAFEATSEVDPAGYFILKNHVLVLFRFYEIAEPDLNDINTGNVLFELLIEDIRERGLKRRDFEVQFDPSYGFHGVFQCRRIEVIDVTPCDKDATPLDRSAGRSTESTIEPT